MNIAANFKTGGPAAQRRPVTAWATIGPAYTGPLGIARTRGRVSGRKAFYQARHPRHETWPVDLRPT